MIINPQLDMTMILATWLQFFMLTTVILLILYTDRNNRR